LYKSRSSTCLPTINNVNEYHVVTVSVSSILTLQLKYENMKKENNWIGKGNTGSHTTINI